MSAQTKVVDESQDQKYFTITPRLVWAFSRNPFDYTLWSTIKGIAGDAGECYLTTDDLALLAMMSTGQVSISRKYWMEVGFLFGDFRRDPGYPQPVWHMRIPNIWKQNVEWAEKYPGLKDRVEFKRSQIIQIKQEREAKKSLHPVKPSPGDGGVLPGEEGVTPGETKNIHKNNQKDSMVAVAPARGMINPNTGNHTDTVVKGDRMDGILAAAKMAAERDADLNNRINDFPPDCQSTLRTLIEQFNWPASVIPEKPARQSKGGAYAQWINEIRELDSMAEDLGQRVIIAASKASKSSDLSISHPSAIKWAIAGEAGKLSKTSEMPVFTGVQTPFARSLNNRTPKDPETEQRLKSMRAKLQRAKA